MQRNTFETLISAITQYFRNKLDLDSTKNAIEELYQDRKEIFYRTTKHGYNCIMVILSASQNEPEGSSKGADLIELIFKLVSKKIRKRLITHVTDDGTTVYNAINSADAKTISTLYREIRLALKFKEITNQQLKTLLLTGKKNSYTPFQTACIRGNEEAIRLYCETLFSAYKKSIVTAEEVRAVLTNRLPSGHTPVSYVAHRKELSLLGLLLAYLKKAYIKGIITQSEYAEQLLDGRNRDTALFEDVVYSDHVENLKLYFECIETAVESKIIRSHDYRNIFLDPNFMHCVINTQKREMLELALGKLLAAANAEILTKKELLAVLTQIKQDLSVFRRIILTRKDDLFDSFLQALKAAYNDNLLSLADIKAMIVEPGQLSRNALHEIAMQDDINKIKRLISFIKELFPILEQEQLLHQIAWKKTDNGYYPSSKNKESNQLLDDLRWAYKKLNPSMHDDESSDQEEDLVERRYDPRLLRAPSRDMHSEDQAYRRKSRLV